MSDDVGNPAAGPAKAIKAIDKGSVHRICSGQVVLNLATAVKELVENALDAGATQIEVKLKEHGSELVEVSDNGCGVEEDNFEGLTLKHHTSKLQDFSDLVAVDTFGFRGEALSSLCALSELSITTCHKSVAVGTRLVYDHNGRLLRKSPCPRQVGTTVSLQNLFSTLPVRYKEFQRNLKKEFNKMVQVLQAYCIISTSVRISCSNQTGKGKKTVILTTNGNMTVKDNITNIFGAKQSILEFQQYAPTEEICRDLNVPVPSDGGNLFRITGYISTCQHGQGRSSTDRQYFYINRRPCDPPKISRTVNEVYHQYNRHQYPMVVLDISLDKESVDVNVTPDKRQIFVQNENLLLATLKSSLHKIFEPESSTFSINSTQPKLKGMFGTPKGQPVLTSPKSSVSPLKKSFTFPGTSPLSVDTTPNIFNLKRSFESAFAKKESSSNGCAEKQRKLDTFFSPKSTPPTNNFEILEISQPPASHTPDPDNESGFEPSECDLEPSKCGPATPDNTADSCISSETPSNSHASSGPTSDSLTSPYASETYEEQKSFDVLHEVTDVVFRADKVVTVPPQSLSASDATMANANAVTVGTHQEATTGEEPARELPVVNENTSLSNVLPHNAECRLVEKTPSEDGPESEKSDSKNLTSGNIEILSIPSTTDGRTNDFAMDSPEDVNRRTITVKFSMEKLRQKLHGHQVRRAVDVEGRRFRAKITPGDNQTAEEELKKEIKKDMFAKMDLLGQFNLGFIIAKLDKDLFIIDQHATDEKYNFEDLLKNTVIQSQPLIQPQSLGLTVANEGILMDNLDIFKKNGFDFVIDENAIPSERARLVAIPMSKNWTFGKDDIDEMVFMLSDSPGVLCRPSRVRDMFASRACRKSVMIGTALNTQEMRKLVNHMGEMDQPWNCPHGRPTMRHLINLDTIS